MATCKCENCQGAGSFKINAGIFELDCPVCKGKGAIPVESQSLNK